MQCMQWMDEQGSKAKCEWRQISMDRTRADGEPAKEKREKTEKDGRPNNGFQRGTCSCVIELSAFQLRVEV